MPGRFANLEFGPSQRHDKETEQRAVERPERTTRKEAEQEAFHKAKHEHQWGRFEPALRLYTRALQEQRALIPAWVGQVQMLVELDECHEARVWSDKGLELFRDNGELLAAKAQACARLRDAKAAFACSDASLAAPGSSPWRWIVRGETLLRERPALATECVEKAIMEPKANWFDHIVIARIYLRHGRRSNALQHAQTASQLEPTHGYVWLIVGNCQQSLGLMRSAEESYQQCLSLNPDCEDAIDAIESLSGTSNLATHIRCFFRRWRRNS